MGLLLGMVSGVCLQSQFMGGWGSIGNLRSTWATQWDPLTRLFPQAQSRSQHVGQKLGSHTRICIAQKVHWLPFSNWRSLNKWLILRKCLLHYRFALRSMPSSIHSVQTVKIRFIKKELDKMYKCTFFSNKSHLSSFLKKTNKTKNHL